jgi:hypothetical protein
MGAHETSVFGPPAAELDRNLGYYVDLFQNMDPKLRAAAFHASMLQIADEEGRKNSQGGPQADPKTRFKPIWEAYRSIVTDPTDKDLYLTYDPQYKKNGGAKDSWDYFLRDAPFATIQAHWNKILKKTVRTVREEEEAAALATSALAAAALPLSAAAALPLSAAAAAAALPPASQKLPPPVSTQRAASPQGASPLPAGSQTSSPRTPLSSALASAASAPVAPVASALPNGQPLSPPPPLKRTTSGDAEIDRYKQEIARLNASLAKSAVQVADFRANFDAEVAKASARASNKEKAANQAQLAAAEQALTAKQAELAAANSGADAIRAQLSAKEAELLAAQSNNGAQITAAEAATAAANAQANAAEKARHEAEVAGARAAMQAVGEAQLADAAARHSEETEAIHDELRGTREELTSVRAQLLTMDQELANANSSTKTLLSEVQSAQLQRDTALSGGQLADNQVQSLRREVSMLKTQLQRREEIRNVMVAGRTFNVSKLELELEAKEAEISRLNDDLAALRTAAPAAATTASKTVDSLMDAFDRLLK